MGRLSSTSSGGRLNSGSSRYDTSTTAGLVQYAESVGMGDKAREITEPEQKLSFLQRLGAGLGAFNTAEAVLTGKEKGVGQGLLTYGKNIVQGLGSAITGKDYQGQRRGYKDVVKELGIENKIAQFGLGFVGDVLLDPSTYFGGAIAKGLVKAGGKGAGLALKAVGKVAPETEAGLRMAGTGLADAAGRAFKYGYKASKGATDDIATFLSKAQQAKLGLAQSNLNRLGTGVLTDDQAQELALKLVAGKRAEFLAREAGKTAAEAGKVGIETALRGTTPEVAGMITKQSERAAKFAKQLSIENPYESYFPFIKKDKLDGFLKTVASQNLQVGSKGYLKQFKNILTNDAIELNPAKAFFTSEAQQVANRMTENFLSGFVGKYGKQMTAFANSDEAAKAGYELLKTKGMLGQPLGYIPKWDAALIKDAITPEFQTINMLAKATGFDAITSLFKRSVTGIFAPFHVRNYMSGHIQNFEALGVQALNPKNINIGQKIAYHMAKGTKFPTGTISLGGKTMQFDDVMKPFVNRFSGDTFYIADFDDALKSGKGLTQASKIFSKETAKETAKTLGLGQESILFKTGRAVGQFIEHSQKATAYVTALGQGKTVQEALELATKAGFDYRQMTRFESQIMRRLVPFYSFTRKNIGLQLSTLGENPQRINQVMKFFENAGDQLTEEEKKNLPAFIRESMGIKLEDTPEGLKQYISSFGTPIEAFTSLFGGNPVLRTISQMNPVLKAPIEIGIGKDSFRQRDLKDVYQANEYKLAPQVIKDLLDIKEVEKPILKKNGEGKLVKVGTKKQYVADPVRLLIARSLFTSRGISYLDQVFGGDLKGLVKLLKTTTGIKPIQVDLEMQKSIQETNKRRALEDYLEPRTDLSKFSKTYIQK